VVEVVEPLGSEILLDVRVGQQLLVARVDSSCRARHHEKIRLTFVPERMYFFDLQTEEAII
jgi:multiple sugar transport system ATP-binding protein